MTNKKVSLLNVTVIKGKKLKNICTIYKDILISITSLKSGKSKAIFAVYKRITIKNGKY